jgi:hypothetical protein
MSVCLVVCLSAIFSAILRPITTKFGEYIGRCSGQFRFSSQPAAPAHPSGEEIDKKPSFVDFSRFDFLKINIIALAS